MAVVGAGPAGGRHVPAGRDEATQSERFEPGGPSSDAGQTPANGALIVVSGDSAAEVAATFDRDPYWLAGFVLRRVVREWNPPLGVWAADPPPHPQLTPPTPQPPTPSATPQPWLGWVGQRVGGSVGGGWEGGVSAA